MGIRAFLSELRQRRVIRAAVIYLAVVWAALQAADLFAGSGIIDDETVRWLIVAGIGGFPVVLVASWFLESPWRERRAISIAGDVAIIVAVTLAAFLFAWQQWFVTFTRPGLAVLPIEATDPTPATEDLADHLGRRLRMLLAARPEIRVSELDSSRLPALADIPYPERARTLDVEFLLTGTLSRSNELLRLSLQLYERDGSLLWSDSFEGRLADFGSLQRRVIDQLWPQLPTDAEGVGTARAIIESCDYPTDADVIFGLAESANRGTEPDVLADLIIDDADSGLLRIEEARQRFARVPTLPPPERPVARRLAVQALDFAELVCPTHPEIALMRLVNSRAILADDGDAGRFAAAHPNSAAVYLALADRADNSGNVERMQALLAEALALDPLGRATLCKARSLLQSVEAPAELRSTIEGRIAAFHDGICEQVDEQNRVSAVLKRKKA